MTAPAPAGVGGAGAGDDEAGAGVPATSPTTVPPRPTHVRHATAGPVPHCRCSTCGDPAAAARRLRLRAQIQRRRAARLLDRIGETHHTWMGFRECDGAHHPALDHDWWGPCSGAAHTYPQAKSVREGVAVP